MPRAVISFSSLCLGIVMTMSPRRYMSWLAPLRTMARSTPASFALSRRALSRSLHFTRLAYQARLRSSSALGTIDSGGPIAAKTDQCSEKTRLARVGCSRSGSSCSPRHLQGIDGFPHRSAERRSSWTHRARIAPQAFGLHHDPTCTQLLRGRGDGICLHPRGA